MGSEALKEALQDTSEVELTVTGRKSGQESSRPVWFAQEGDRILLMPVGGSGANWYRNVLKTPGVRLAANGAELRATAKPIDDAAAVADTLERFRTKYGADRVDEYYPRQDVALEVPLD